MCKMTFPKKINLQRKNILIFSKIVLWICSNFMSRNLQNVALLISTSASIFVSGALHEPTFENAVDDSLLFLEINSNFFSVFKNVSDTKLYAMDSAESW